MEIFAGEIHGASVRQMSAVGETHAHHRITRFKQRKIHRSIRLRTGMRLNVGVLRTEKLLRALAGDVLDHIHIFAAAVIAMSGIALGIFVRQMRTDRRHHCGAYEVFGSNQLNMVALTSKLIIHRLTD